MTDIEPCGRCDECIDGQACSRRVVTLTEIEALRAEIDELRYDAERWNDQARAEFARIERAILILTDSPSTPFASASAARAALLADG